MPELLMKFENGRRAFLCPGCRLGHYINTTWEITGSEEAPTVRPSILVTGDGLRCHSYITDGKIEFLSDSSHALAGLTVPMEAWMS